MAILLQTLSHETHPFAGTNHAGALVVSADNLNVKGYENRSSLTYHVLFQVPCNSLLGRHVERFYAVACTSLANVCKVGFLLLKAWYNVVLDKS